MESKVEKKTRKLPVKYASKVMPLLLSIFMTCIVSLVSTLLAVGFTTELLGLWPQAWLMSWLVAFPTLLMVLPVVQRLTRFIVEPH